MLTKNQFIEYISENYDTTKKNAGEIIDTFVSAFMSATKECGGINLVGFAKSEVVDVPEKNGVNPSTGAKIVIPAHKAVKVKISKKFRNLED